MAKSFTLKSLNAAKRYLLYGVAYIGVAREIDGSFVIPALAINEELPAERIGQTRCGQCKLKYWLLSTKPYLVHESISCILTAPEYKQSASVAGKKKRAAYAKPPHLFYSAGNENQRTVSRLTNSNRKIPLHNG